MDKFFGICKKLFSVWMAVVILLSSGRQYLARAEAEDDVCDTVQLDTIVYAERSGKRLYYTSPNKLGRIYIRTVSVADADGTVYPAFYKQNDSGKIIRVKGIFAQQGLLDAPFDVTRFLDYFYYKFDEHTRLHEEYPQLVCTPDDEVLKKTVPDVWGPGMLERAGTWIQTVVWLWQSGSYTNSGDSEQLQRLADEWDAITKCACGGSEKPKSNLDLINKALTATDPKTGWVSPRAYREYRQESGTAVLIVPATEETNLELPVIGATGYALIELPLYSGAESCDSQRTISAGTAFLIMEEAGQRWYITGTFGSGWVSHTCCMINLPDVIPSIVYDVTNGYSSLFRSSGYDLEGITGQALYAGQSENPRLGREEFMVPVLYAMAKKIASAQAAALAEGDTLVLYEGYRPLAVQEAVRDALHKLATSCPEVNNGINRDGWSENWFIAQGISNHQRGYAIDVSLAKVTTSEEKLIGGYSYTEVVSYTAYNMPSDMHELSIKSVAFMFPVASDASWRGCPPSPGFTAEAKRLQDYCTAAGLIPLASEWWHFNDLTACRMTDQAGQGEFEITECLSQLPSNIKRTFSGTRT